MVEKEETLNVGDDNTINPNPEGDDVVHSESAVPAAAEGGASEKTVEESAFEKAWGKAIIDDKVAEQQDG